MVKTGLKTFVLLGMAMLCVVANAGKRAHKIWMAEVDYEFSYQGFTDVESGEMPKTAVLLVSGNNTCRTTQTEFLTSSIIGNKTKNTLINLAVTPEIKSATLCDSADIAAGQASLKFDIQGKGKYKKILGYPCHGYDIVIEDVAAGLKYTEEVWATDYIGGKDVNFYLYPEVKGVILYSKKTDGKEVTVMQAKAVSKRVAIEAGTFWYPYGCEVNTCSGEQVFDEEELTEGETEGEGEETEE